MSRLTGLARCLCETLSETPNATAPELLPPPHADVAVARPLSVFDWLPRRRAGRRAGLDAADRDGAAADGRAAGAARAVGRVRGGQRNPRRVQRRRPEYLPLARVVRRAAGGAVGRRDRR